MDEGDGKETSIVECDTSVGKIVFELYEEWSPLGYERAVGLFESGFYDGSHFFRVIHGFLVQFGISYTEDKGLRGAAKIPIKDDPPIGIEFDEGIVSFAGSGPNSRTSHLFIAYGRVPSLGRELWETPIGKVIEGIENVRNLNGEYGDGAPHGKGPAQHMIESGGRKYMEENFPNLDYFRSCTVRVLPSEDITKEDTAKDDDQQVNSGEEYDPSLSGKEDIHMKDVPEIPVKQRMNIGKRLGARANSDFGIMTPALVMMAAFLAFAIIVKRRKKKITKVG